jgi:hypothetical protein
MADAGTFCTTAEVLRKAGVGANSISVAEAYTNQYVQEAEGFIMASCNYDFKTNYASLISMVKEVLREATSNLAAIYSLSYDMFGYTSLEESQTMISFLKLRFDEDINVLREMKNLYS